MFVTWEKTTGIVLAIAALAVAGACAFGKDDEQIVLDMHADRQNPENISLLLSDHSQPVPTGPAMNDPTFRYLAEKTGTSLSIEFIPHSIYNSRLKVEIASGFIPDVVQDWRINPDLYANKRLLPLNDLLGRYGRNLKSIIPQEAWAAVTIGGKIYGIPEAAQGNSPSNRVIYVRKDWMDKAGIREIPKTPDEFLDMLRAFRDEDPNGNGKKDEIPFSSRANLNWSENVMGMFGVTPSGNHIVNGEVIPDIIHPRMKEAIAFFRTMVEENLIDDDFLMLQRNVWEQKIQSDLVGSWNHVTDLAWDWQYRLNQSLPGKGAEVIAIPTPRAPGVREVGMEKNAVKKVFNITTSAQNPEAIVKMFDWLASEEGQEFVYFGVPDVTYRKVDGEIQYDQQKDLEHKTAAWRFMLLNLNGYNKALLTVQLGEEAANKLDATYAIARQEGIANPLSGMPALPSEMRYPDLSRYGPLFVQSAGKIMLGEEPVDYFDEFVRNWRSRGGDEIVREMNDWYEQNGE